MGGTVRSLNKTKRLSWGRLRPKKIFTVAIKFVTGGPGAGSIQRAIYHVQKELQTIFFEEKKWTLGLCDRGTLDGLAYWPGKPEDYLAALGTTLERELNQYYGVIHPLTY